MLAIHTANNFALGQQTLNMTWQYVWQKDGLLARPQIKNLFQMRAAYSSTVIRFWNQ